MNAAFKYLTALLFVAVVCQVGFAGYGAFNAIDKADKEQTITKKTIENGFDPHGLVGTIVLVAIVLVAVFAALSKADTFAKRLSVLLIVLGALQVLFAWLGTKSAPLGFLHGINALALYAAAAFLAHRAWTQRPVTRDV